MSGDPPVGTGPLVGFRAPATSGLGFDGTDTNKMGEFPLRLSDQFITIARR
jgi:hypothetical protein